MKTILKIFACAALAGSYSGSAAADTTDILGKAYSYQGLITLWEIGLDLNTGNSADLYDLEIDKDTFSESNSTNIKEPCNMIFFDDCGDDDDPWTAAFDSNSNPPPLVGDDQPISVVPDKVIKLKAVALTESNHKKILSRMAKLGIYLSREVYFRPSMKDPDSNLRPDEKIKSVRSRRNTALAEMMLINLRLYSAEKNIVDKCTRIKAANNINTELKPFWASKSDSFYLQENWQSIVNKAFDVQTSYEEMMSKQTVCNLTTAQTAGEVRRLIRAKVDEELETIASAKIDKLATEIGAATKPLQTILNRLKAINIPSREIQILKSKVADVNANLKLVQNDMLEVQSTLDGGLEKQADEKFPLLTDATKVGKTSEITEVLETKALELGEAFDILQSIKEELPATAGVESCANLRSSFDQVITKDKEISDLENEFKACIESAETYVKNAGTERENKTFEDKFSEDLRKILEGLAK